MHPLRRSLRRLLAVFAFLILAGIPAARAVDHPPLDLEVDVSGCTVDSVFEVYFDVGDGILDTDSIAQSVTATPGPQHLSFPLPAGSIRMFRLDPMAAAGALVVDAIKLVTPAGVEVRRIDLHELSDFQQIPQAEVNRETGALPLVTTPDADDPQCYLKLAPPLEVGPRTLRNTFWTVAPDLISYDLWLDVVGVLWLGGLALLARRWFRARWPEWRATDPASRRSFQWMVGWGALPVIVYAWLLLLALGHSGLLPDSESSWVAVMTYAVAHHWQFGPQILLTYGPAMPVMAASYSADVDTLATVGQLLIKAWFVVLSLWLGRRLSLVRRVGFWVAAVLLFGGVNAPALFSFSVVMVGLVFARSERAERWLLAPTLVYLTTVTLIKVSFLLSTLIMLAVVSVDLVRQKRGRAALALVVGFVVCFCTEWCLFRQHLGNLPVYFRGSFELVRGFTQAMEAPPDLGVLILALAQVCGVVGQLVFLFLPDRRPRWDDLPMIALLAVGLGLSWKASFVRADGHVFEWFTYAMVSATVAPAFVRPAPGVPRRWLEPFCLGVILLADVAGISRLDPTVLASLPAMLTQRPLPVVNRLLHLRSFGLSEQQEIELNRATYALPEIRKAVGQHTVDMLGDEQSVALLNHLNFRPRPSFVAYSTYTPWLINLNVNYYCSPQAPDFVLFKLVSIDLRMPTLQSGPLLVVLAEFYTPVLTEGGYVLFQRRAFPQLSAMPASFALLKEGNCSIGNGMAVPEGPVWCELEMRETLWGRLLRMFYQQPTIEIRVDTAERRSKTRYVPAMGAAGFLLNPALKSGEDLVHWMEGQPTPRALAVRIVKSPALSGVFQHRMHYKFYRVPTPPLPPAGPPPKAPPEQPGAGQSPEAG